MNHNNGKNTMNKLSLLKETLLTSLDSLQLLCDTKNANESIETLEQLYSEDVDDITNQDSDGENSDPGYTSDSQALYASSHVVQNCVKCVTLGTSYDYRELAGQIVQYVSGLSNAEPDVPDWSLLSTEISKNSKVIPRFSTVTGFGIINPEPKKEIKKTRAVREALAPIVRPEKVVTVQKEEQNIEHTIRLKEFIIRNFKANNKPLDYFRLVLHPTSFATTTENIMHVAFLVRDSSVALVKDESGILHVQPRTKDFKSKNITNSQNILQIDMDQWEALVKVYRIKKPMLNFKNT